MRKSRYIISLLIIASFYAVMTSPVATTAQGTEAKIGLLTPLTGALGSLGPTFENGAQLAINDLNAKQDVYNFKLVVEDTQTSATATTAAATALVTAGVSGVVGAAASSASLSAIEVLAPAKIPQVSYASTSPAVTDADDDGYLFRVVPSDAFQGRAGALLAADAGVTKVGVIGIADPYGQGLVNSFLSSFVGTVEANVAYDQETETDFTDEVTALVDAGVDAVYMVSFVDDGAAIINELNTQGFTGLIIGTDGIASSSMFEIAGIPESMDGVIGTAPSFSSTFAWQDDFYTEFCEGASIFVAQAYDATMLIGESVISAGSTSGADVKTALSTVGNGYVGVSGTITFDANGDMEGGTYDLWQVKTTSGAAELLTVGNWLPDTEARTYYANIEASKFTTAPTTVAVPSTTVWTQPTDCNSETSEDDTPVNSFYVFAGLLSLIAIVQVRRRN